MSKEFKIGSRVVGEAHEPFIIAEAGINHNGDIELAKKMILAAKDSGVDAVKFQTFRTEEFLTDKTVQYTYRSQGKEVTESEYEMFKRTEFSTEEWKEIKAFCDTNNIEFLSTPVSIEDAEFLKSLGVNAIKIGSDDCTNTPLINKFSMLGLPLLIATGMATAQEMEDAIRAGGAYDGKDVCLFLCTSQYPTPAEDVNALKLIEMKNRFSNIVLGFSDHSLGSTAAVLATGFGARVFEKHFTLDHNLPGPDHWFSSTPNELRKWVDDIRTAYQMLGKPVLAPTKTEQRMRAAAHRSVTALISIKEGEVFTEKNLGLRRPGAGLPPVKYDSIIGKKAARNIEENEQIKEDDIIE